MATIPCMGAGCSFEAAHLKWIISSDVALDKAMDNSGAKKAI